MRYLWELHAEYRRWTRSRVKRTLMTPLVHYLRLWDYASAARVDRFVANSDNVRRRIRKVWRREADVVFPPVAVEKFEWKPPEDYFLMVGEMVPYKRMDDAVRVCTISGRKLKVVGNGPEFRRLRRLAGPTVEFCGHVPDAQLSALFARSRALLMPGEEDFGITAVEALAAGKPVISPDRGGVPEILAKCAGPAGVLYPRPGLEGLTAALGRFEGIEATVPRVELRAAAAFFSEARFQEQIQAVLQPTAS
jgi:glycosyltransferase involved in cell wall biosynthesis